MRPLDLGWHPIRTFYSRNMAPAREPAGGGILGLEVALGPAAEPVLVKSSAELSGSQGLALGRGVYATAAGPL